MSLNCSLNGVHVNGRCICDLTWHGDFCGLLSFAPVDVRGHPGAAAYGWAPNVSTWGGSVIYSRSDGLWHLFVAQMKVGGLREWQTQSECVHAHSDAPGGPFSFIDISVKSECHGPTVVEDPATGELLMFHQGDSGWLHHAKSASGPWHSALGPQDCGMPSAAFHPNGTLYVVCGNGERIVMADGNWTSGMWRVVSAANWTRPKYWEDPTLWFDDRGNWHVIFHVYSLQPFSAHGEKYSGHAYSTDGLAWHFSKREPYNGTVDFTDGWMHWSKTFATRERPQLVFQPRAPGAQGRGSPIGLVNGVSPQPLGPWCDACEQHACSQCKVSVGRD